MDRKTILKAIKYTPTFNLIDALHSSGDTLNVFIEAENITFDFPPIQDQRVYGARPYSVISDLVAIVAHMGILFPIDKPKKATPTKLATSPIALKFGKDAGLDIEDIREVDCGFKFYGVVVTVIALQPLENYPEAQGFAFVSSETDGSAPFAVDIVNYYFVSEFEPMPIIVSNSEEILEHHELDDFKADGNVAYTTFEYSPDLFSDQSSFLFRDFSLVFSANDETYLLSENRNGFKLEKKSKERFISEPYILVAKDFRYENIIFEKNAININNEEYKPVLEITLVPKSETYKV